MGVGDDVTQVRSVLVVCTGNICRSPYIEALLADALLGTGITVSSAGTGAVVGAPMNPHSLALLDGRGIDGSAFRARQLTPEMVADADLVIGATREHARFAVALAPWSVGAQSHSLGDLAVLWGAFPADQAMGGPGRRARPWPGRAGPTTQTGTARGTPDGPATGTPTTPTGWVRWPSIRRPAPASVGDIVDPYLQSAAVWQTMVAQVAATLPIVAATLRSGISE